MMRNHNDPGPDRLGEGSLGHKAKDRAGRGERVTTWIAANPDVRILTTIVALTSDREFHCLSMVLICSEHSRDAFVMSENQ
jgi:hypothetical protein